MIKLFISHSSRDVDVATLLVELTRLSLNLNGDEIRCTSVDGYRLPAGVSIDEQLRQEIFESVAFIALISESSLQSTYVLFELGARWGARKHILPLLLSNVNIHELAPPLSGLSMLRCDNRAQLHQLIYDLSRHLNMPVGNPAVYDKYMQKIIDSAADLLTILHPRNGDIVPHRPFIEGTVKDLHAEVWLIVHPLGSSNYWIQPKAKISRDGTWRAQIYIGRSGSEDVGAYYEVCAVANPRNNLNEGDVLHTWPPAEHRSGILELLRG